MKKKYKLIVTSIILVVILGISVIHLTDKLTVNTEQVEKTDFQDTIEENGSVVSADKVTLSAELNGVVLSVVKENTPVTQGQAILTIDSSQIEHQIAQLRGNLQSIQGQKEMSMPSVYQSQIEAQKLEIESTKVIIQNFDCSVFRIRFNRYCLTIYRCYFYSLTIVHSCHTRCYICCQNLMRRNKREQ